MASRLPLSGAQYFNATGKTAYAGAKMYTYTSLSRTVNKTTWDAADEATPLANPIVADADGIFPEIYGDGAYFINVYNSDDSVLIYQPDELYPTVGDAGSTGNTVVSNVVALKALDVTVYTSADVLGTTATNDGGQVRYYYDASSTLTDNGISVVTPDVGGGRWLILPVKNLATGWMPLGSVDGLKVTNGTDADHDVNIAVGSIADTTQAHVMTLGSAFVKQIDATFAVGTALGGLSDDDTLGNDTWYGVFLLSKSNNPTDCDVILATTKARSLSDSVATSAGFDISRLIGYVVTDASANILPWVDNGSSSYLWDVYNNGTPTATTAGASLTVRCPPFQQAILGYSLELDISHPTTESHQYGVLTQTAQTNTAASAAYFDVHVEVKDTSLASGSLGAVGSIVRNVKADGSSQIRHRESSTGLTLDVHSYGWLMDYTVTDLV